MPFTTHTLNPVENVIDGGAGHVTVIGAPTPWQAVSDNNDGTYVQFANAADVGLGPGYPDASLTFRFADPSVGADVKVMQTRICLVARQPGSTLPGLEAPVRVQFATRLMNSLHELHPDA